MIVICVDKAIFSHLLLFPKPSIMANNQWSWVTALNSDLLFFFCFKKWPSSLYYKDTLQKITLKYQTQLVLIISNKYSIPPFSLHTSGPLWHLSWLILYFAWIHQEAHTLLVHQASFKSSTSSFSFFSSSASSTTSSFFFSFSFSASHPARLSTKAAKKCGQWGRLLVEEFEKLSREQKVRDIHSHLTFLCPHLR